MAPVHPPGSDEPRPDDLTDQSVPDSEGNDVDDSTSATFDVESLQALGATAQQDRIDALTDQIRDLRQRLQASRDHGSQLSSTLRAAREQLVALREEVARLTGTPQRYALLVALHDDDTATVAVDGRQLRVDVADEVDPEALVIGREVLLNDQSHVVGIAAFSDRGELVAVVEVLDDEHVMVTARADEERVVVMAEPLRDQPVKSGDTLLVDLRANLALERVVRPDVERLVLEELPDVGYEDIGGLAEQVEAIRDAVELPYLHPDLFAEHDLSPPKGVLLYGPPGCGKTMIAKAVARSLADSVAERTGREDVRSHFINVKGPELLNKYVGETERQLRLVFQRAREKAAEGVPVIVFFDEMESLFRTRGSGVSSDMETTIVPQLLAEIDGVETLNDVLLIGASNREDLIDPAILRPGRLDVKIKVSRPDAEAAREIFRIYLHAKLPLAWEELSRHDGDALATVDAMVNHVVDDMYADHERNRFLEVTYASGDKDELYFRDFNSGAMIANIVDRAKKAAIKRFLDTGDKGLHTQDLLDAVRAEFRENEDLPNTTNPDDWARISGRKGERIVYIRTLTSDAAVTHGRTIETVQPGQYL